MKGVHINTLNVYTQFANPNSETLIWSKRGNQGNVWINGRVNIISNDAYKIAFEAVRGINFLVCDDIKYILLILF